MDIYGNVAEEEIAGGHVQPKGHWNTTQRSQTHELAGRYLLATNHHPIPNKKTHPQHTPLKIKIKPKNKGLDHDFHWFSISIFQGVDLILSSHTSYWLAATCKMFWIHLQIMVELFKLHICPMLRNTKDYTFAHRFATYILCSLLLGNQKKDTVREVLGTLQQKCFPKTLWRLGFDEIWKWMHPCMLGYWNHHMFEKRSPFPFPTKPNHCKLEVEPVMCQSL